MKLVWALFVSLSLIAASAHGAEISRRADRPALVKSHIPQHMLEALRNRAEAGNANDYMDQVLALVREEMINNGLDRIALPDGDLSFSMPFWPFGTVSGGVFLYGGFLSGMETITRVGDATLSFEGNDIFFASDCGINNAAMGYSLAIKFLDIGPEGSMAGKISYAHFAFLARINLIDGLVEVQKFDIKDIGTITTDITGLGIFNWLAELIANLAINLLKGVIKEILQGPMKFIINKVLQSIVNSLMPTTAAAMLIL